MLSVLVEGTLISAPVQRTGAKGSPFVTAQVRCHADDGESLLVSVIAFGAPAAEALARLDAGDAVAIAGPAAISRWEKNGEPHVGLRVTATRVMSVYDAGLRRRTASREQQDQEPPGGRDPPGAGRVGRRVEQRVEQWPGRNAHGGRRDLPVRPPPVPFDDDGGPV